MAKLFVSYARRDGSSLALRLADDLARAGHEAWLDKAQIRGGASWAREIESAIDGCDALLALMSNGSKASNICEGEHLRALRKGRPVIPLLLQADADRPLYLEARHYLDFSDEAAYAQQLAQLHGVIAAGGGARVAELDTRRQQGLAAAEAAGQPIPHTLPGAEDWAALRGCAVQQMQRFRDALVGHRRATGLYEPALHVARPAADSRLTRLTNVAPGSETALVLIGAAGAGKTHLLAHWAEACADAGDAVFAWHGEQLSADRLEAEIARAFGYDDATALRAAWPAMDALAMAEGRRIWLLLDGLNDARGERDAVQALLQAVDQLVERLPVGAVRVVMSCTCSAWQRLDEQDALRLAWHRYQAGDDGSRVLLLDGFTPEQVCDGWQRVSAHAGVALAFDELPPAWRERIREPVLMRLLADALHGVASAPEQADFDTLVFGAYRRQRLGRREDLRFVEDLAAEMLVQRRAALSVVQLMRHPVLGAAVTDTGPNSPCTRLVDDGILSESPFDAAQEPTLRFSYPQIGADALLQHVSRQPNADLAGCVCQLVAAADTLPLAWEAALMWLGREPDAAVFDTLATLAGEAQPPLRQLACEAYVRRSATRPESTLQALAALLENGSPVQQRTALRAVFLIGPAARGLLVNGALSPSAELRVAVRDTLYLLWQGVAQSGGLAGAMPGAQASTDAHSQLLYYIWRHAPDVTRKLMQELVGRLRWTHPKEAARILGFVLDLTITIYVNHCERADVVEQTAQLFHELTVERLHLDKVVLGAAFERVVFRVVSAVFSERLLQWMLLEGDADPAAFFRRPLAERAPIAQAAAWLDPATTPDTDALHRLLASDTPVMRGVGTLVLAVQSAHDSTRSEPLLRALFERLDTRGRHWLLAGHAVLWPGTPASWVPLLDELTQRLAGETVPLLPVFDGLFVPLALAQAKAGLPMAFIDSVLARAPVQPALAVRALDALGVVGFYHPQPVLALLRPHLAPLLANKNLASKLVTALATIRTLHFDRIDRLLQQASVGEAVQREVAAGADPVRVQQFMRLLGYYNNAVHACVHHPRMRRGLTGHALELLAHAPTARDFVSGYATKAITMAREAGFDLRQWTLPDPGEGPAACTPLSHTPTPKRHRGCVV